MAKLWGGRFGEQEMSSLMLEFSSSLSVDNILAEYDCASTKVHVEMLASCGIVSAEEKKAIIDVLDKLALKIADGSFAPESHEDIHSAIQDYVESKVPEAAKKMHTGRSRNEQVVNDVRLYTKDKIGMIMGLVKDLQKSFVGLAEKSGDALVPGYTHLNRAQPVLFAHLVLSYVEMLDRDIARLKGAYAHSDISVMGSGALAGSALELDRKFVAKRSGFSMVSANSMDAVSDRDFMVETLSALSIIAVHLSRVSEDLILYSLPEFGFIDMGSDYCTGSSLMPQKKNPDVLELVRGKSAGVISALNSLLVLLKGLPQTYNRDLQEDKKPLFEAVETVAMELAIMAKLIETVEIKSAAALKSLEDEFIYATDIAEYLVRKGVAFKDAHDIVGGIVKLCSDKGVNISDLSITELKGFCDKLEDDVFALLNPETSVSGKKTPGSTNPDMVKKQVQEWKKKLK